MKRNDKRLYYNANKQKFLVYNPIGARVIEESLGSFRHYLKDSYVMPSRRGYKLIGILK